MTTGQILFDPNAIASGETPAQAKARVERNRKVFREALNNAHGKAMLALLTSVNPPYGPSFTGDFDPIKAAHRDGERGLISLMALNGTDGI